ncbi:MAG: Tol-Pal system protein TolB [Chlamydiae bacterium]|nr:Tol-Pal system protein TolB [Chlamydiota bacterium]
MKKLFLIISILFTYTIFSNDVLEVVLTTNSELKPLYLSNVQNDGASFEPYYLTKLRTVMEFDLTNNGYTTVTSQEPQKELKLSSSDEATAFDYNLKKKQKIPYIVRTSIRQSTLSTIIFSPFKKGVQSFSTISLTGDLSQDRRKIHKLCNSIQESLFGKKGIAESRIIYSVKTPLEKNGSSKFKADIWICDYDGANKRQLTTENSFNVHPVFIPDKNKGPSQNFLYVSYKQGQPKIYLSSLKEGSASPIIHLRGNQLLPSISMSADKIAFISDAAGRPDLFLQNYNKNGYPSGKPWQLFSSLKGTQASPTFSPDGRKIAFVSDKDGSPRIYVIQIPSDPQIKPIPQLITKKNRQNVSPCWSYDGKKLAFSAKNDDIRQIWVYDFETSEEWQLTKGPQNKENPYWASDSLHIVYNTEEANLSELYIINLNQKEAVKISEGVGNKRFPAWEPH